MLTPSGQNCPGRKKLQLRGPLEGWVLLPPVRSVALAACSPGQKPSQLQTWEVGAGLPSAPYVDGHMCLPGLGALASSILGISGVFQNWEPDLLSFSSHRAQTAQPASVLANGTQILALSSGGHHTPSAKCE